MLPLLETTEYRDGHHIWTTTDLSIGTAISLEICDVDQSDPELFTERLGHWIRTLNPSITCRVATRGTAFSTQLSVPRAEALHKVGARKFETIVSLELPKRGVFLNRPFPGLLNSGRSQELLFVALHSLRDLGFIFEPLSQERTKSLFVCDVGDWGVDGSRIESPKSCFGVLRLQKPLAQGFTELCIAEVLRKLEGKFQFVTTFKRLEVSRAELFLQRRLKQVSSGSGLISEMKSDATEGQLARTSLMGVTLCEYESILIVERESELDLRRAVGEAAAALKVLGVPYVESIGAAPSFVAAHPGSGMHVPLLESDETLPLFLPVYRFGSSKIVEESPRALTLHRLDDSLVNIDILQAGHQNSNALIVGASGRGKSAMLGCLTQSLLSSPDVHIIKVDVGGSHSRAVAMNGGLEYRLGIEEVSGLNPFDLVQCIEGENEFVRSVIGQFIETLVREEGEIRLPKQVRVEIDNCLRDYFVEPRSQRSLDDFYQFAERFPRRLLLSRWCAGGLYAKAFSGRGMEAMARLRYFNFSQIFQAADPDFAQAAMAAVLATFNLEMRANPNRRLVLVCDETPFFIERCFDFFKFSTANVRKFGAAVFIVVQLSQHLEVDGDTGVIENCAHRILFSADGLKAEFMARLGLCERDFSKIEALQFVPRKYSDLLYQYGDKTIVCRLKMSREEYWRVSSTQDDRLKLEALMKAVPSLQIEEAIRCLALEA